MRRRIGSARRKLPGRACAWPPSSASFSWLVKFSVSAAHFSCSETSDHARCSKSIQWKAKPIITCQIQLSLWRWCDGKHYLIKISLHWVILNIILQYINLLNKAFPQVAILQAVLLWWRMPPTSWWTFSASSSACCPSGSPPDPQHTSSTMAGTGQVR